MKTNDIFILAATAAYSYLFYNQHTGINFLLFNAIITTFFFLKDRNLITKPAWLAAAVGSIFSSFFVFWWGTTLPVLANICSLSILAGLSFDAGSSLLFAVFNTCFSLLASLPLFFHSASVVEPPKDGKPGITKKLFLLTIPAFVALIFAAVYYNANPIFARLIDQINFDFISLNWVLFTIGGFFIMFGVFNIYRTSLNDRDKQARNNLPEITAEQHAVSGTGSLLSVPNELMIGVGLFALLNLVLLMVNGLDIFYMWIANRLPAGITMTRFLHNGTDSLIISIVMAIAVILFVFRGYLNFIEQNKWLKMLAYTWIMQNLLLVITTANTNWWYIESYGLTRKRIGVYVYLLLCIVGLISTYIKVAERKSNWFLFRKNAWVFYAVFVISCFFNWDLMIVNYNFDNFKGSKSADIDWYYQTGLSHTCLAANLKYYYSQDQNELSRRYKDNITLSLNTAYKELKQESLSSGWQSFCVSKNQNLKEINEMIERGEITIK